MREFAVESFGEPMRIKAIAQQPCVLPEHLIDHKVRIEIDRCGADVAFRLTATEHIRAEYHHVTDRDDPLSELAEQQGTAVAHYNDSYAVICDSCFWVVRRLSTRYQSLVVVQWVHFWRKA